MWLIVLAAFLSLVCIWIIIKWRVDSWRDDNRQIAVLECSLEEIYRPKPRERIFRRERKKHQWPPPGKTCGSCYNFREVVAMKATVHPETKEVTHKEIIYTCEKMDGAILKDFEPCELFGEYDRFMFG